MDFPLIVHQDYFDGISADLSLPERVLFFTRTSRSTLDSSRIHRHSRYNLMIALDDDCSIALDGAVRRLGPEHALLTHPWQTFRFVYEDDAPLRWAFFSFDLPHAIADGATPLLPRDEVRSFTPFFSRLVTTAISRYFESGPGPWLPPLLAALLAELPRLRTAYAEGGAERGELIARVQRYVLDRLDRRIRLSALAAHCAYSESRLRGLFAVAAGVSIGAFVRRVKLNEAARLLASTDLSVCSVAEACGFSSVYAFSRCFARELGVPPLRFRKERRS